MSVLTLNKWNLFWRISTTSTLTGQNFFLLGLPIPQTPNLQQFSALVPQSQGGQSRQGYVNLTLLWSELDRFQAVTLKSLVDTVLTAGTPLYLTVDFSDGTYGPGRFADVSGTPIPLTLIPTGNSQQFMYSNVELKLNNVTVITVNPTGL